MQVQCSKSGTEAKASVGHCPQCGGIWMIRGAFNTSHDPSPRWPHTPLVPSHIPGLDGVLLKYEGGHITGSFKDRIMRLTVAQALERGATGAVVP